MTDANLLLGYLGSDAPLAGGVELDRDASANAVGRLARELELDRIACAEGIIRVANAEMVRALRVVTVQRGVDPRGYALLAFGGAGPLHAAAIADELGITTILCPRASGVLAALGLVVSPRRRDVQNSVFLRGEDLRAEVIADVTSELGEQARAALGTAGAEAELHATYELRYRGQAFELPIRAGVKASPDALREAFEAEHRDRYGYSDSEQELELVTVRVTATTPAVEVPLTADRAEASVRRSRRAAVLDGEELRIEVVSAVPEPGTALAGPAVIELPESTLLIPHGWSGDVMDSGTIRLERTR